MHPLLPPMAAHVALAAYQFEWPLLFYVACVLLIRQPPDLPATALAWTFVGGRVLHTGVQVFTRDVRLRGLVFMVNFLAVLGLWGVLLATG